MQSELPAGAKPYIPHMPAPSPAVSFDLRKKRRICETLIEAFLMLCGAVSIITTVGIVFVLVREALLFFQLP